MLTKFKNSLYGGSIGAVTGLGVSTLLYSSAFAVILFFALGLVIGYIHP